MTKRRPLRLVGVVHLAPLPGSPRSSASVDAIARAAGEEARILKDAGFDAVIVENFGDAPFLPRVGPVTVSAMTVAAMRMRDACPDLPLGINVLRNDADAALAIARIVGAQFIRVNVHVGARVTDQGVIEGEAGATMRTRMALGSPALEVWADVDVKHSAPLGARPVGDEAADAAGRGLADAILVTGDGTGRPASLETLRTVKSAVSVPVYVASGVTLAALVGLASACDGVIVGSALRNDGRAGGRIDSEQARRFAGAFLEAFSTS